MTEMADDRAKAFGFFAGGIILLVWLFMGTVVAPQDTGELVAMGKALASAEPQTWQDASYRPPLPLFLAGILPESRVALSWIALMGGVLWVFPAVFLCRRLGGSGYVLAVFAAFAWPFQLASMSGDTRLLGIALGLWGIELLLRTRLFWAGFCIGAAALCRYEYVLLTPFVTGFVLWIAYKQKQDVLPSMINLFAGWGITYGMWIGYWSSVMNKLVLLPRSWEMKAAEWLTFMPDKIIHLLIGSTSFDSGTRDDLKMEETQTSFPDLDFTVLLGEHLFWYGCGFVVVGVWSFIIARKNDVHRPLILLLMLFGGIGFLAAVLPQGRSLAILMVLPALAVMAVMLDVLLGEKSKHMLWKAPIIGVLVYFLAIADVVSGYPPLPPAERTAATTATRDWLAENAKHKTLSIDSSFDAHASFGGRLGWKIPGQSVAYVLLTPLDDPWLVSTWLIPQQSKLVLEQAWETDDGQWSAILLMTK